GDGSCIGNIADYIPGGTKAMRYFHVHETDRALSKRLFAKKLNKQFVLKAEAHRLPGPSSDWCLLP
ncbi:hypothetical protein, partial [Sphaerochaeta sp.]